MNTEKSDNELFNTMISEPGKATLLGAGGKMLDFQKIGRVVQDGTDSSPIIIDLSTDEGKAKFEELSKYAADNNIVLGTPENFDAKLQEAENRKNAFAKLQHAIAMSQLGMNSYAHYGGGNRPGDHFYNRLNYKRKNGKWSVAR